MSDDHFAANPDDLQLFVSHGHNYARELHEGWLQCQQRQRIATEMTGHQSVEDSVRQLGDLETTSRALTNFVASTASVLESESAPTHFGMARWWPFGLPETNRSSDDRADPGGGLGWQYRGKFDGHPLVANDFERGLSIIDQSFEHIADGRQIATDEFEAIVHENGNVTLVLPGVIDLSSPHLGYDPVSRSSRDLDQVAIQSAFSSELHNNAYAIMVAAFVSDSVNAGLFEKGADVLIVGHSFGADTALDLAASSQFNGGLVNVTHVVAAGYHSEPQLDGLGESTKVAVLQNIYDVPVLAEGIVSDLLPRSKEGIGRGSGFEALGRLAVEGLEFSARFVVGAAGLSIMGDRVKPVANSRTGDGGFVAEFEGGRSRFGHHPDHYRHYIGQTATNSTVSTFVADIGEQGYGSSGAVVSVDISLPAPNFG